ncbi:MAG TPA: riboflavin kinase [Candidatus Paceibacterota bacterium]|nr:riboflavin kinase [Candidatus Paceibacterota bacterium]
MQFSGTVGPGRGFGRTIGFPTVNIPLTDPTISGIYAAVVRVDDTDFPSAAYADPASGLLEAHLIDWVGDLYGKDITITLGEKVRERETFQDEISLMAAIAADVAMIRESFKK